MAVRTTSTEYIRLDIVLGLDAEQLGTEETNHGHSDPEQFVEPDPRQALQGASGEEAINRGRRGIPIYHRMETPEHSRAESMWGTPGSQNSL